MNSKCLCVDTNTFQTGSQNINFISIRYLEILIDSISISLRFTHVVRVTHINAILFQQVCLWMHPNLYQNHRL